MADLKKLRVCLSKDLPLLTDRDPQYIYFLYDKLTVFLGQSLYSDPYAIVEEMPTDPINGMLYFVFDGYVKVYIDYSIKEIAQIENDEQLELLKQTGTTFFVNAERRYLDLQRRIITLPYQNGSYELTVSAANNLILDKDTVIAFNTETNQFDIVGKRQDYDLVFTTKYRGKETNTASVTVSDNKVSADIKISSGYDNILKFVKDGLYANVSDRVTKKEFDNWKSEFQNYKSSMEEYLKELSDEMESSQSIVSPDAITAKIQEALEDVYPEIDEALAAFENISEQLSEIEKRSKDYTDSEFDSAYNKLYDMILEVTSDPWENFGGETADDSSE